MEPEDALREPPKPQTDWKVDVSVMTMSADPICAGDPNGIGGLGLIDVKSLERSQVVCHCDYPAYQALRRR